MHRVRPLAAVLPALIPGACVLLLAFQAGGFFPGSWAALGVRRGGGAGAADRARRARRSPASARGAASRPARSRCSASGSCSRAAGRTRPGARSSSSAGCWPTCSCSSLCASLAPREHRLAWALRGLALAIGVICVVALITRLRPDIYANPGSGSGAWTTRSPTGTASRMLAGRRRHPRAAPVGLRPRAVARARARRRRCPRSRRHGLLDALARRDLRRRVRRGGLPRARVLARDARGAAGDRPDERLRAHARLRRRPARRRRRVRLARPALAQGRDVRDRARCCASAAAVALRAVALLLDRGRGGAARAGPAAGAPRAWRPPPPS